MKKNNFTATIFLLLAMILLAAACKKKQLIISPEPANGSAGDVIVIKMENASAYKQAKVTIGEESALVISSSDSEIVIMLPPMPGTPGKLRVQLDKQSADADFQVNPPASVLLWFAMKNDEISFTESQASSEEFVQDKSYSSDKWMYEITDANGEVLVLGYINNPAELEVPSTDKKGFSKIKLQGEIKFSVNVPAFSDMKRIRFTAINASTKYQPKAIGDIEISVK